MNLGSRLRHGVLRGTLDAPVTESVVRLRMNDEAPRRRGMVLRATVFLEVEVMREQREDEDAADEIAPWEMWP